jgi:hypothetical protein
MATPLCQWFYLISMKKILSWGGVVEYVGYLAKDGTPEFGQSWCRFRNG